MYWFIFIGNNIILRKKEGRYSVPEGQEPPISLPEWAPLQPLPEIDGTPCRACQLRTPPAELPSDFATVELRSAYSLLPTPLYQMAGKASELLFWDANTQYCGHCGGPMERSTDISKRCKFCGKEVWPQVAPAIIVRIRKVAKVDDQGQMLEPERILLVHALNFRRKDYYGLVAGFVETGESLEECVRREVHEETQLEINNIRYFGSQPWPFPCGIMIGFTADYASGELHLQNSELSKGGWFDRNHLPHIPDESSIARHLIDNWLKNGK